jgi:hypothetical protein
LLRLFFLIYPIPDYFLSLYFFKSTGYTSNQKTSVQSVFKYKINYYPQNGNSLISCNGQSSIIHTINNFIFASDFSNKNFAGRGAFKQL